MPRKKIGTHPAGGGHGAACGELLALLNEYIDGGVDPSICRELEAHMAKCKPCRVVVDNVRKTITLYRRHEPCELPAAFRARLHAALRKCWKDAGPGKKSPKRR